EYSAIFALLPQVTVGLLLRRQGRQVWPIVAAAGGAGLGWLPWLGMALSGARLVGDPGQYQISIQKIATSLLSLSGVGGNGSYFYGAQPTPWDAGGAWQVLLLAGIVPAVLLGALATARRGGLAALTVGGLLAGTILVAASSSVIYPSYVERTILYAVLGWALLVGAAAGPWAGRRARLYTGVAGLSLIWILVLGSATLVALYTGAIKQQWRDLAADTAAVVPLGWPLVAYPTVAGTLVDLYQPQALHAHLRTVADGGDLPVLTPPGAAPPSALWLVYTEVAGIEHVRTQLAAGGYTRLLHRYYPNPLYLDFYARPDAALGHLLDVNGEFAGQLPQIPGWQVPASGAILQPAEPAGHQLTLTNRVAEESQIVASLPATAGDLYSLRVEAQAQLQQGRTRAFLICATATGAFAAVAPDGGGASVPNDATWHPMQILALCPAGTQRIRIDLRNAGSGTVSFRHVTLQEAQPLLH
ncbi:MAG TPA: hypothetical protein VKY74_15880, partial [Chloroflexia bacterium]|nr:hypothetical protein [Chloroflexia bacterium]